MARSVTLTSLEAQVRQRSDTESLTARFTSSEVTEYINQTWAELYNYIINTGQDYYLSSYSFNTSSGTTDYALPSDFFLDRGIDVTVSGRLYALDRWQFEEREQYDTLTTWSPGMPWSYTVLGSNVSLRPAPGSVQSMRLWYYPTPTRLVSGSDTLDGIAGFEEYIVNGAAAKILVKDDRDPAACMSLKSEALALVTRTLSNRSRASGNRVVNNYRRGPTTIRSVP